MVEAACHCGAVRLTAPQAPREVTACNCSICRRIGALWAYYERGEIGLNRAFHRCRNCGCVTHWLSLNGAYPRMAINARMMDCVDVDKVRIRRFDGAKSWTYVDEAEGAG
jgi:hypothetical protein